MTESHHNEEFNSRHSKEINEIIGSPPNWILRSGIFLFSSILVISLLIASMIDYPEKTFMQLTIISSLAKAEVKTPKTSVTTKILVKDGSPVKTGQILAFMDNQYDHQFILNILHDLINLKEKTAIEHIILSFPQKYSDQKMGELLLSYRSFLSNYNKLEGKSDFASLKEAIMVKNSLIDKINEWKRQHVIIASKNGILNYNGILQENQLVTQGTIMFVIYPTGGSYYGILSVPEEFLSKVKNGQRVIIKPKRDVNNQVLYGKIAFISHVPDRNYFYASKVVFDESKEKKAINDSIKEGTRASAEVIIQKGTVLDRIIKNLKNRL